MTAHLTYGTGEATQVTANRVAVWLAVLVSARKAIYNYARRQKGELERAREEKDVAPSDRANIQRVESRAVKHRLHEQCIVSSSLDLSFNAALALHVASQT